MNIEGLIKKWKLNNLFLAGELGLIPQAFSQKLNKIKYNKFTDEQKNKLKKLLAELSKDIKNLK